MAEMANEGEDLYQQGEEALNNGDYAKAITLFEQAAERKSSRAELALGKVFYLGPGVPQDFERAFSHFQRAKETVDNQEDKAEALYYLAQMLRSGFGVERNLPTALDFLLQSADLGNCKALRLLGRIYSEGLGVAVDGRKALAFYERAAENDYRAKMALGEIYSKGIGVPVDGNKAVAWYEKAAETTERKDDNPEWNVIFRINAMDALSKMYRNGIGIPKDEEKATFWWEKSKSLWIMCMKEKYGGDFDAENWPTLSSWSDMLRDYLPRNLFKTGSEVK